jgi:hypothetical protein
MQPSQQVEAEAKEVATTRRMAGKDAAANLAHLMERQMGFTHGMINPTVLRLFLHAYWERVSTLAHAIHADND